jgi:putative oxidoreductase
MNVWVDCYAPLIGRIFVGGFFLWNGIQAALNFPATMDIFAAHGVPGGLYWAVVVITIEALGGIALVMGLWMRPVALALAVYLLAQSAFLTNFGSDAELNIFVLNLALAGGLIYMSSGAPVRKNRP